MKKLLLVTTALVGVAMMSAPANAAVKLGLGGYFSTYGMFADSDQADELDMDWRRDSELFFTGATTLDNGLTVGINYELDLGSTNDGQGPVDNFLTDEAYMYFSGGWGRLNIGSEDGSAFLLQVTAPSADANIDGMQVTMQGTTTGDAAFNMTTNGLGLKQSLLMDYQHVSSATGVNNVDRLSYLTPKFNGFQGGVSYAPQNVQGGTVSSITAMGTDNNAGTYDDLWEAAVRWDGEFQGFGIAVGGGYSDANLQADDVDADMVLAGNAQNATPIRVDGLTTWNAGANLAWSGFSLGGSYSRSNTEQQNGLDVGSTGNAVDTIDTMDVEQTTWVVGLGYDNGPWHLGTSYWTTNIERDASGDLAVDDGALAAFDADIHRYTVGAGYTFGPGMTFNGSVAWGEFDNSTGSSAATGANLSKTGFATTSGLPGAAATNNDFQQVVIGTNIQF
jgi:hypothetical protein